MFPLEGFTENDADISIQTWSNQGSRWSKYDRWRDSFVVAKNYNGGTNWAISSPFTHAVGNESVQQVNTFPHTKSYLGTIIILRMHGVLEMLELSWLHHILAMLF